MCAKHAATVATVNPSHPFITRQTSASQNRISLLAITRIHNFFTLFSLSLSTIFFFPVGFFFFYFVFVDDVAGFVRAFWLSAVTLGWAKIPAGHCVCLAIYWAHAVCCAARTPGGCHHILWLLRVPAERSRPAITACSNRLSWYCVASHFPQNRCTRWWPNKIVRSQVHTSCWHSQQTINIF